MYCFVNHPVHRVGNFSMMNPVRIALHSCRRAARIRVNRFVSNILLCARIEMQYTTEKIYFIALDAFCTVPTKLYICFISFPWPLSELLHHQTGTSNIGAQVNEQLLFKYHAKLKISF